MNIKLKNKMRITSNEEKITVRQFIQLQVYVDPRFQRNACWSSVQIEKFLVSLNQGFAVNPIINADAKKCEKFCAKIGEQGEQGDFKHVIDSQSSDFISVDGQNRTKALKSYVNNEFSSRAFSKNQQKKYFKDLSKEEKEDLLEMKILVVHVVQATYSQLTEIFTAVNSGAPLNRMELRNAKNTPIARFIRELAKKYPFVLNKIESVTEPRMKHLDTLLKIACFMHSSKLKGGLKAQQNLPFSDNALDEFYNFGLGKGLLNLNVYGKNYANNVNDMLQWLDKVIAHATDSEGDPVKVTMPLLWALCSVYRLMKSGGLSDLRDYAKASNNYHGVIYDVVHRSHLELTQQSHIQFGTDSQKSQNVSKVDYYCYFSTDVKCCKKREKVKNILETKIPEVVKEEIDRDMKTFQRAS
jgi:hypothetical protein